MGILSFTSRLLAGEKAKQEQECRRIMRRQPQRMKYGYLWCDSLITPRPCMIKDLSVSGAKVQNIGEDIKPRLLANGFRIYFADEKREVQCSLAWMKGQMMGLKFESGSLKPSRAYKAF
jgi:hypothetical protein